MNGVHPVANETALRYLAEEIGKLYLMIAQLIGNNALERHLQAEKEQAQKAATNGHSQEEPIEVMVNE
jgi:hypothetical protein